MFRTDTILTPDYYVPLVCLLEVLVSFNFESYVAYFSGGTTQRDPSVCRYNYSCVCYSTHMFCVHL
jgi:hypothetical protein